ncbi:MAG: lipocalin-like domain-containing protein [Bacteroidaceae bacterium]|nr:lipocalin-like domain-containing protein [Bacteroidaceae bacterium]
MVNIKYLFCFFIVSLVACDKLPQNDDLDGMWHLQKKTTFNDVNPNEVNVSDLRIYWNFQLDLLEIVSLEEPIYQDDAKKLKTDKVFCRFDFSGHTLCVNQVYLHFDNRDSLLTDTSTQLLERYGIMGCRDTFNVEHLGSKQMILVSDHKRLCFRKF